MKTICNFCKTEYNLGKLPSKPVVCFVCGNIWTVAPIRKRNYIFIMISSVCALIAAILFAAVIITKKKTDNIKKHPIVAELLHIKTIDDALDEKRFVVTGKVYNQSQEMYGVPNLLIISLDEKENIVAKQKFMAPATILESGESVEFTHTLSAPVANIKKITVELTN